MYFILNFNEKVDLQIVILNSIDQKLKKYIYRAVTNFSVIVYPCFATFNPAERDKKPNTGTHPLHHEMLIG